MEIMSWKECCKKVKFDKFVLFGYYDTPNNLSISIFTCAIIYSAFRFHLTSPP